MAINGKISNKNLKGLSHLAQLVNLNLSNNYISSLANLAHLPNLQTLSLCRSAHCRKVSPLSNLTVTAGTN